MSLGSRLGPPALMLAGLVTALAICEGVARVVVWSSGAQAPAPRPAPPPDLPVLRTIAQLAAPNARGINSGVFYRTNSAGFRGREYARAKPAGTFRIVIGGDSFTMGMGVVEEEAYPGLLESELNRDPADRPYEVLNLGIGGLNARDVVARIEYTGLPFNPDLIIYGCAINDLERLPGHRPSRTTSVGYEQRTRLGRYDRSPFYLLRLLGPRWESLRQLRESEPGSYMWELRDNFEHNPAVWQAFAGQLDRLAAHARARGICAHVFVLSELYFLNALHPFRPFYDRIAAAAVERGLTVTQSFPTLRGNNERALHVSAFDAHPNTAGHRLLARALADGLRTLPARCWRRPPA